jgi:predicted transcriptional regulator
MSECVDAYITECPLTVNADVRLVDAEELMKTNKVRCLVVTDADASTPIGTVEFFDF